ncbi:MAG TPA: aminotransferase class IV [Planctomycetota bacterium]|nr:aminotransferase class IV [Planctomycetota bacterium]
MSGTPVYPASVNGRILPEEEAGIAPGDEGLLLGLGVFETLAVESGVPLFLEEHLVRMAEGGRALGLRPTSVDPEAAVRDYLGETGAQRAALRITWTRGPARAGSALVLTARDLPAAPAEVSLAIAPYRKDAGDPLERVKTVSRARAALARERALARGAFDALVATTEGDFAEGTVCNLFVALQGSLRTPPPERGVLPGTVRKILLASLPLPVREERVRGEDLAVAEEAFVTNSLVGVLPVAAVEGFPRPLPGAKGRLAGTAAGVYRAAVERYVRERTGAAL